MESLRFGTLNLATFYFVERDVTTLFTSRDIGKKDFTKFFGRIAKGIGSSLVIKEQLGSEERINRIYFGLEIIDPDQGLKIVLSYLDYDHLDFSTGSSRIELTQEATGIREYVIALREGRGPVVYVDGIHNLSAKDSTTQTYTRFFEECKFVRSQGIGQLRSAYNDRSEFYPRVADVCKYVWGRITAEKSKAGTN